MLLPDTIYPRPGPPSVGHVLMTRYNLRTFRGRVPDYEKYLEGRAKEFLGVCLPSVLNLERKPERWLIGFDGTQPQLVSNVVKEIEAYPWIQPVWQGEGEALLAPFEGPIREVSEKHDFIATTRMDNDDALNKLYFRKLDEYINSVFDATNSSDEFWIIYPFGVKFSRGVYYCYMYTNAHFSTRVSPSGQAHKKNVLSLNHKNIYAHSHRVYNPMTRVPMWLQNVHENNVVNSEFSGGGLELSPAERLAALFWPIEKSPEE